VAVSLPWALPASQPAVADLDGDGASKEILLSTSKGLWALDKGGTPQFTRETDVVYETQKIVRPRGVALGDLNDSPGREYSFFWSDYSRLYSGHWSQNLTGFPVMPESRDIAPDSSVSLFPMLFDVDGDGRDDVILPTVNYYDNRLILNLVDRNSRAVAGFP
jgi:hypothetical protein